MSEWKAVEKTLGDIDYIIRVSKDRLYLAIWRGHDAYMMSYARYDGVRFEYESQTLEPLVREVYRIMQVV